MKYYTLLVDYLLEFNRRLKLRSRMFILFLGSTAIVLFVSVIILSSYSLKKDKVYGMAYVDAKADQVAGELRSFTYQGVSSVENLKNYVSAVKANNPSRVNLYNICREIMKSNSAVLSIWPMFQPGKFDGNTDNDEYSDVNGGISYSVYRGANGSLLFEGGDDGNFDEEYYTIPAKSRSLTIIQPYEYAYYGNPKVYYEFSVAIPYVEDNEVVGVLGADLEVNEFVKRFENIKVFTSGFVTVLSSDFQIISYPDTSYSKKVAEKLMDADWNSVKMELQANDTYSYSTYSKLLKSTVLRYFKKVEPFKGADPWFVMVEVPEDELYAGAYVSRNLGIAIGVVVLLLIAVIVYFITDFIVKPIRETSDFAKKIADGVLTAELHTQKKHDEIGEMINALNTMRGKLEELLKGLRGGLEAIVQASSHLSFTSQELSEGAVSQAASVEEVSSTMEQMASNIEQNSENSLVTERITISTREGIHKVAQDTFRAVEANRVIADKIKVINEIATLLSHQNLKIVFEIFEI